MHVCVYACMSSSNGRLRNTTLHIESARIYDEGMYVCVASNTLGQSHDAAMLTVAGNFFLNLIQT